MKTRNCDPETLEEPPDHGETDGESVWFLPDSPVEPLQPSFCSVFPLRKVTIPQCGAPKIAKLVNISPISLWFMMRT